MPTSDTTLMTLARAILADDRTGVSELLAATPVLPFASFEEGAAAGASSRYFLEAVGHHVYAGDTALHLAAVAHRSPIVAELVVAGADVGAKNRRGGQPLHYAADGVPGSVMWNPHAQAETITCLIRAGADPNAADANGSLSDAAGRGPGEQQAAHRIDRGLSALSLGLKRSEEAIHLVEAHHLGDLVDCSACMGPDERPLQ